jgi:hypothetical protein
LRPLPVCLLTLLIPATAELQSGRRSRAAAEFCATDSLDNLTYRVKGVDSGSQKGHLELLLDAVPARGECTHRVVVPGALFESQSLAACACALQPLRSALCALCLRLCACW